MAAAVALLVALAYYAIISSCSQEFMIMKLLFCGCYFLLFKSSYSKVGYKLFVVLYKIEIRERIPIRFFTV
jgi:hypothetical protein